MVLEALTDLVIRIQEMIAQPYFGVRLDGIIYFLIVLGVFFAIGKTVNYLFKTTFKRLTAKTKTQFDDIVVEMLQPPILFLILALGFFIAFQFLGVTDPFIISSFNSIISAAVILILAWTALKATDAFLVYFVTPMVQKTETKLDDQLVPILRNFSRATIIVFAIVIVLGNFGIDVTALIAGLGIGGLALAFAAKDTLSNAFGGFTIFLDKPFTVGDWISFGDISGTVTQVGLRTTKIEDINKRILTVPNEKVSGAIVTNVSSEKARRVSFEVGLTYETNMKKMHQAISLIKGLLAKHKDVGDHTVRFMEFAPSSLNLKVIYYITNKDRKWDVMHEVNMAIKEQLEKAKIDMAYPTQTVYLKK